MTGGGHPSVRQREGRAVWAGLGCWASRGGNLGREREKKKKKGERLGWANGGKREEKRKLGRAGKGEREGKGFPFFSKRTQHIQL